MKNCNNQLTGYEAEEIRMSNDERKDIYSKAVTNRQRVRVGLEYYKDPKPLGFRTQGSYAMRTMIRYRDGDYDVDDGIYFSIESLKDENGNNKEPLAAREMVCKAAADKRFNTQPKVRDNCVRIYFNEGYHIDVPVYRQIVEKNPYTDEVTKRQELAAKDTWRESDPLAVTDWFKKANSKNSSDATASGSDGQLVRIVRLLKAFARSRKIWCNDIATGFSIAKLVVDLFSEDKGRDDRKLRDISKEIVNRLKLSEQIAHPVLNENIAEHGDAKVKFFREKLEENLPHLEVLDDAKCTHAQAMSAWDKFFNTEWFSKQPDPDEEDEVEASLTSPAIKRGDSRYALSDRLA